MHPPKPKRWPVAATIIVLLTAVCSAQDAGSSRNVLTNRDVVTLADAGLGEPFIIEMIGTSRAEFDTTADGIADLKKHGVKEDIIRAMRAARPSENTSPKPDAANSSRVQPVRVFVEVSPSTLLSQSHPQTAEIVEAFARNCPALTVTSRRDAAMFVVVLDRSAGKLLHPATARMVVVDRAGDTVYGASTRALGKAVRGFCASAQKLTGTNANVGDSLPGNGFFAR
jgi:hypothetical protein